VPHQSHSQNTAISFVCLNLFPRQLSCTTHQLPDLNGVRKYCETLSNLNCLLGTLPMSHLVLIQHDKIEQWENWS